MSQGLSVGIIGGGIGGLTAALSLHRVASTSRSTSRRGSSARSVRFHLPDGPEQEERDRQMATRSTDWSINAVAWIYGHDAGIVGELDH